MKMNFIYKLINSNVTHRTDNTRNLDHLFDPSWGYKETGTLASIDKELLASWYLERAREANHFVAVPRNSIFAFHRPPRSTFAKKEHVDKLIEEMIFDGYLLPECVEGDVEVISPGYKMCLKMYRKDKKGNNPNGKVL